MDVTTAADFGTLSATAARRVAEAIRATPDLSIVVATGNSPMRLYAELAALHAAGTLPCDRLRVFQLDAYLGVADDDPRSLYGWMRRAFIDPLGIAQDQVVRIDSVPGDPAASCAAFAGAVRSCGGLDLAVLGIGPNGHLGFNEPPSDPESPTRDITLSEESIASNAAYWGGRDRVPRRALTAGMDVLLSAREVIAIAGGAAKRRILDRVIHGPMTPEVPASYLRTCRAATLYADHAALGLGEVAKTDETT